ncbi:PH domain-containing protein [Rossellomorea vietnamensis]|uniref:PH domain-containing protein n=1 Tax=Rossellomorea vietnamensis TaxID=218284 RepID=UPI001E523DC9|nr:PH domain-containing protein [Rossellomorea vietnamensis]MCC5801812.1 PH domain-containing protein [Rossellomorea vietnamensis]
MSTPKRYHPLMMVLKLWSLIRGSFFFVLFLFVIKAGSDSLFIYYGRWGLLAVIGISLLAIPLKWLFETYAYDNKAFYLNKGIVFKSEQTIAFSKIHNVNRHVSVLHRLFGLTALHLDTAAAGEDASVKFEALTLQEAEKLEELAANKEEKEAVLEETEEGQEAAPVLPSERTLHFRPTKKDTIKASFISLGFLFLVPLLFSFYSNISDIWNVDEEAKGIFSWIAQSPLTFIIVLAGLLIVSAVLGVVRTYLKYGAYELSSDKDRIYITNGVIELQSFSILKERVQAVELKQSLIKRMFGMTGVELISIGQGVISEGSPDIKSLYPFLPTDLAYELVAELLPGYQVEKKMNPLPLKSLAIRMIQPSWIWVIATGALFWFKPAVFGIAGSWIYASIALLIAILVWRWLNFLHTGYLLRDNFVQFKKGFFESSIFYTKREKVIEVEVSQSRLQKLIGAASISTINRAKPIRVEDIRDIPYSVGEEFYRWYLGRKL